MLKAIHKQTNEQSSFPLLFKKSSSTINLNNYISRHNPWNRLITRRCNESSNDSTDGKLIIVIIKNYSLCPKNIFLESWKMTNFETPYLKNKWRDWLQISRCSSFWSKLQWCEIWVTSSHPILRYEASKLGIFKLSRNRTIFLGQREYYISIDIFLFL